MKLDHVAQTLNARMIAGHNLAEVEVAMACGADLMSDVLAFAKPGALLLTGLTNVQVVRTAEMIDVRAICFVRGKNPPPETVEVASTGNLPLLATDLPMFEACGRLFAEGLAGCSHDGR